MVFSKIFASQEEQVPVPWKRLTGPADLQEVEKQSFERPVLVFKHSTRCSISSMSLDRFERSYRSEAPFDVYFLDLIAHRDVSNLIAEKFAIRHESPQVILIKDGKPFYDTSHMAINYQELAMEANKNIGN